MTAAPPVVAVDVVRRARRAPQLAARRVRDFAERMLVALGLEQSELSVLLTDDARMRILNRQHRGKDRSTDVLAFPIDGRRKLPVGAPRVLGDIVISIETAARQARGRRRPLLDEMRLLLAHGIAHLIGYDHATVAQKRRMDPVTRRLVAAAHTGQTAPFANRSSEGKRPNRTRKRAGGGHRARTRARAG